MTTSKEVSAIADDVIEFWRDALGLDEIGPDDDFFELGGNSVTAIRLLPLLDERFAVKADVLLIFDYPTPRELATRLAALGSSREDLWGATWWWSTRTPRARGSRRPSPSEGSSRSA